MVEFYKSSVQKQVVHKLQINTENNQLRNNNYENKSSFEK
jgi:hypothetical protein